ncbi:MAG TPA: 3D domain-containing protein [Vicinamibacterales bacterium]|nr:3D domain-containing protein [Vicinamibacterales bacterium]
MKTPARYVGLVLLVATASACAKRVQQPTPTPPAGPLRFSATAYCTGSVTAAGTRVSEGIVAADPAILPIGTIIRIAGAAPYDGSYRVLDTGPRVRKRQIDVYIPDCAAARRFGRRQVDVTIIRRR